MSPLSPKALDYLRRTARSAGGYHRRALVRWLRENRAPVLRAHIAMEEAFVRLAKQLPLPRGGEGVLQIGDLRFGAVGLYRGFRHMIAPRRPEGIYVLVGVIPPAGRIYMDRHGRLHLQQRTLFTPLATSPFVHIERLAARDGVAPWAIEAPRRAAVLLAGALGVPLLLPASDPQCAVWCDAHLFLMEGRWERPLADAATLFIRSEAALAPLVAAMASLGIPARTIPAGQVNHQDTDEELGRAPAASARTAPMTLSYAAPTDRCSGEIALDGPALVQTVRDERGTPVERGTFTMDRVTLLARMRASSHLAGRLSGRALAYLDARGFRRDPRWTSSAAALSALLDARGLPRLPVALAFEELLGGLVTHRGAEGPGYGVFLVLRRHDDAGHYGGSDPPHPGGLVVEGAWPHVRWNGRRLVPVGHEGNAVFYGGDDGLIYAHIREIDVVLPAAADPRTLIEGFAVEAAVASMQADAIRISADMGEPVARALGLYRDEQASDAVRSFWHAPGVLVRADHGAACSAPATRVDSNDPARLAASVRAAFAWNPDVNVGATHYVYDRMHAIDSRVQRCD
ncbi:MAG TPA: hypothetical protein VLS89_02855 [Candidatus Nanopelagicales bacterium]|nr:hypothetical protein [Candidatus Nanopelagicales bacterium]